ncbi:MAG: F-type H+-transporting ATPase subunit epsilon [Actinomycetota bacterium]|jgi:F-type H+-transporting ATPase subunit epsilon|nr:F-type H+-transporting ATPase subunit epsilon [Actinomycetota bacterium]
MLTVEVVSPEAILFTGEAEMVVARTLDGEIAFQPGHVSFLGALEDSSLRVLQESGQIAFAVHGGFVEVSNDRVTVLSDVAESSNAIDVARATAAFEKAEAALRADPDDLDAADAVKRASTRLDVARAT